MVNVDVFLTSHEFRECWGVAISGFRFTPVKLGSDMRREKLQISLVFFFVYRRHCSTKPFVGWCRLNDDLHLIVNTK